MELPSLAALEGVVKSWTCSEEFQRVESIAADRTLLCNPPEGMGQSLGEISKRGGNLEMFGSFAYSTFAFPCRTVLLKKWYTLYIYELRSVQFHFLCSQPLSNKNYSWSYYVRTYGTCQTPRQLLRRKAYVMYCTHYSMKVRCEENSW